MPKLFYFPHPSTIFMYQNEELESLSLQKYKIMVNGIVNTTSIKKIQKFCRFAVGTLTSLEVKYQSKGLLTANFITEFDYEEFASFEDEYLKQRFIQTELGNINFRAIKIQMRNMNAEKISREEERLRRVKLMSKQYESKGKSKTSVIEIFAISTLIILAILYLGYLMANRAVGSSISLEDAVLTPEEQNQEGDDPLNWQNSGKSGLQQRSGNTNHQTFSHDFIAKQANNKISDADYRSPFITGTSNSQNSKLKDYSPPPSSRPNQQSHSPSNTQKSSQGKVISEVKITKGKYSVKYSKEEERKKEEEELQKLPRITPAKQQEDGYFSFTMGEKTYTTKLQRKQAVIDAQNTLMPGLKYLRRSDIQIYSFPPSVKKDEKHEQITYTQFKTQQDRETATSFSTKSTRGEYLFFKAIMNDQKSQKSKEKEYLFYNKTYNLDQKREEKPMCVVSSGRNLFMGKKYDYFFSSINAQNYSNFHVYHIDDDSEDNTTLRMFAYISDQLPHLHGRVTLIRNLQNLGAFSNKDSGIKENCSPDSIVLDIDADDGLIGYQVMNTLNAIYSTPSSPWLVYSNFIMAKFNNRNEKGFSQKLNVPMSNYRRSDISFRTSHLKTYYAKLEMKIPIDYLIETDDVNGEKIKKYSKYSSDGAMMFSMLELAGNDHVLYVPHFFYKYRLNREFLNECHHSHQSYDALKLRSLVPLKPLKSFDDTPGPIIEHSFPKIDLFKSKQLYYRDCFNVIIKSLSDPLPSDKNKQTEKPANQQASKQDTSQEKASKQQQQENSKSENSKQKNLKEENSKEENQKEGNSKSKLDANKEKKEE